MVRKLVIVVLLGALGFGIYYWMCRYKAYERLYAYDQASMGLRQDLLKVGKAVTADDLRTIAKRHAKAVGVKVERLDVTLEPLSDENKARLPLLARKALGIVAVMPGHRAPACIAGYHVWLAAKSGMVTKRGESLRFTYFDDVDPEVCPKPESDPNQKVDWRDLRRR